MQATAILFGANRTAMPLRDKLPWQLIEQCFRGTQIGCLEALGEALVDPCQKLPCLVAATLLHTYARETEGGRSSQSSASWSWAM